ncbi:MAG: Hsp20/alpha crystallin family protein, partial [Nitrospirae bacterium]
MSIMRWSPMKELEEMRRDMERLFEEFFKPVRRRWYLPEEGVIVPNIELYDRKTELVLRAELPGVKKDDIHLTISDDRLTIKGEMKKEEEVSEDNYYISEIRYGTFSRTITLPYDVDSEKVKATFKDGILEVVLPKKEEARPK